MDTMEIEITPAFPTLIGQLRVPDAEAMNQELKSLILAEESKYLSLGRSNIGGWHSRPDLLTWPGSGVDAVSTTLMPARQTRTARSVACWSSSTRAQVQMP
jgi:hypothetical protein